ncbi:cytochrome c oxidase assembly protein COX16 homolog, mitochondrial-like [Teleopsis dalmanni]|uniref:cytochrome c oxidase assembly protein COX16 homolog, mitochondrial-like n=1 Tax=Teleopsis dalmanni TaxID=139649 RepID=UPI0018CEF7BB|nr:cytochrome c oxidase assembly protein COX16 homolog, mitochondrial-like [Teleopsis dalmanni]
MSFSAKVNYFFKQKSVKYGIPFLLCIVGGSFGLQEFAKLRYQFSKTKQVTPEDMKKYGVTMKKSEEVTLENEFEKIQTINIDEWENKRGPRPWEEIDLAK